MQAECPLRRRQGVAALLKGAMTCIVAITFVVVIVMTLSSSRCLSRYKQERPEESSDQQ